jgi:superfamily II DNA or RNA helicase
LDVLIRAEVTKTAKANTQIAGRLSRTYEGKSYGLLVDCIDGFDKTLRASSNARCAYYRKMGWTQEIPDEQT